MQMDHTNWQKVITIWDKVATSGTRVQKTRSALNASLSAPIVGSAITKSALKLSNVCTETTSINTEEKHDSMKLSLDVNEIELSCCAKEMLKEIWDKATDLLKSEDSIIKAPGFDDVFVKHFSTSETSKLPPHLVTSTPAVKYQCDCKLHKSIKLGKHTVAASDIQRKLNCFIDWRKEKHQQTSRI